MYRRKTFRRRKRDRSSNDNSNGKQTCVRKQQEQETYRMQHEKDNKQQSEQNVRTYVSSSPAELLLDVLDKRQHHVNKCAYVSSSRRHVYHTHQCWRQGTRSANFSATSPHVPGWNMGEWWCRSPTTDTHIHNPYAYNITSKATAAVHQCANVSSSTRGLRDT